ncbi:unnamed protein product [Gordionus sp. m RMFG-2023]
MIKNLIVFQNSKNFDDFKNDVLKKIAESNVPEIVIPNKSLSYKGSDTSLNISTGDSGLDYYESDIAKEDYFNGIIEKEQNFKILENDTSNTDYIFNKMNQSVKNTSVKLKTLLKDCTVDLKYDREMWLKEFQDLQNLQESLAPESIKSCKDILCKKDEQTQTDDVMCLDLIKYNTLIGEKNLATEAAYAYKTDLEKSDQLIKSILLKIR